MNSWFLFFNVTNRLEVTKMLAYVKLINNSSLTISTHYNIFTRNKMNGLLRVSSNNIWADLESEMSQPVHRGAV